MILVSGFKMSGMCFAEIMFPLSKHKSQISDPMLLHSRDLLPPLALAYDTEQALSHLTLICFPLTSLHNDLRPKRIAFSSRTLMCIVFSSLLQLPPVLQSALAAPHACKPLSVVIYTWGGSTRRLVNSLSTFSSHQLVFAKALLSRLICLSKL